MDLAEKIQEIKNDHSKVHHVSPCELVNYFGYQRRSWRNAQQIYDFLNANELELGADFYNEWFYSSIELRHKKVATTKVPEDPIKRVQFMQAANNKPIYVDKNASLIHAITLMQQNDYSQLPVVSSNERNLCGYISWATIGAAKQRGELSDIVKDYMEEHVCSISKDMPLLEAINITAQNEFVIVLNEDKTMRGIITTADVASEFLTITQSESFILLGQIERQIRIILRNGEILLEDVKSVCKEDEREVMSIDDLNFGEYLRLLENDKNWKKLKLNTDRKDFIEALDKVRQIRNDVMHFDPDGIDSCAVSTLRNVAKYLTVII
jgi:predicted transcriptional regulator